MKQSIPLLLSARALTTLIALGGTVVLPAAWAANSEQPTIQSLTPHEVASGALTPETANGITYVSGGIGIEERAWLAEHGKEYNTHATFAVVPGGEFVADVSVQILTHDGKMVLKTTANGPQLMAQLPAGSYQLIAHHDGQVLKRAFTVAGSARQTLVFGFSH
jgi:hypothetical protein